MSFDHSKWDKRLKHREQRKQLFEWASKNAICTVTDIEFCDCGNALRLKGGRVVARRNLDSSIGVDWFMVGCAGIPSDLVF